MIISVKEEFLDVDIENLVRLEGVINGEGLLDDDNFVVDFLD